MRTVSTTHDDVFFKKQFIESVLKKLGIRRRRIDRGPNEFIEGDAIWMLDQHIWNVDTKLRARTLSRFIIKIKVLEPLLTR